MIIEKLPDFIKITPDEGKYILSKNDNIVSPNPMYLTYLDNVDNYTEITEDEITKEMFVVP